MDLRRGSKRIKSIYKGKNYIPGLMVNGRLWQGAPGKVVLCPVDSKSDANCHKIYYGVDVDGSGKITTLSIESGGMVKDATVHNYGAFYVFKGVADNTNVTYQGSMNVVRGIANNTIVSGGGIMEVSYTGTANHTTVGYDRRYGGGAMYVHSGGTAHNTTVEAEGYVYISSGVHVSDIVINSGGTAFVASTHINYPSCFFSNVVIMSSGMVKMNDEAIVENITVSSGGMLYVYNGGSALNVTSMTGADIQVHGGTITYTNK